MESKVNLLNLSAVYSRLDCDLKMQCKRGKTKTPQEFGCVRMHFYVFGFSLHFVDLDV